ncbi:MAG TPA: aromatic ring-hydroxylating dioxygenase subunit alpha [Thiobacillaceae bacterium]|nr:aromatic ring-hydroxylating dioxygenase subunit alpha [Thiobacillaceae bacterium]
MSNLADSVSALSRAKPQLPVSWYLDPEIHALEHKLLFAAGPNYVGHELMVPETGDYHVLEGCDGGKVLVRSQAGIELLSNICRHRQAVMLRGRGRLPGGSIVCPVHRWTYNLRGELLGAPHFAERPCLNLASAALQNWNGLLFAGPRNVAQDLAGLGVVGDLDFSGYKLDRVWTEHAPYNWKTFIEVYLDDYHVEPFHPGLGNFVTCDDLRWEYGEWYSVQTVGVNNKLAKSGSPVYGKWHDAVLSYRNGEVPAQGAIWLTYYPNIMVEWYPHVLVISTVIPTGVESCANIVEFYYPEDIILFEREFIEAEQAAYVETAQEDHEIAQRMHDGRRALHREWINEVGPYQSPYEDGMVHFHEFLRRQIEPYLSQDPA